MDPGLTIRRIPASIPSSSLRASSTLPAVCQICKLCQAITALRKAEAETESRQRKVVEKIDLDQPLDSVVLSKLGDSFYERYKILLPAVVDSCDT